MKRQDTLFSDSMQLLSRFLNRYRPDGDPLLGEPEIVIGSDFFTFIGVLPSPLRLYPRETHIAEKLHAYTMPRREESPNSRMKDLPDLALLGQTGPFQIARIRQAIEQTFSHRGTHSIPSSLPDPPGKLTSGHKMN